MKPPVRILVGVVVAAIVAVAVWRAWAPRAEDADLITGYVEGDTLYLSSPTAGSVTRLSAVKGQRVAANAPLFDMDPATLDAQRAEAAARAAQARVQIGAAGAQASQAQAALDAAKAQEAKAQKDLTRNLDLQRRTPGAVAATEIDALRAAAESATAQRQGAERALAAAQAQTAATKAAADQAAAALTESGVKLGQLSVRAPAAGRIEEVFYQTGEWANANQPVLALLPDDQVKLRFYAPESAVSAYRPGGTVQFACDGCKAGLTAKITSVADRPEFTPPIIYSRKTRDKLVFLIEAAPAEPAGLTPGQPVDVTPLAPQGAR